MRFICKKSVCSAALGLLLAFYFVRKRKAQDGRVADAVEDVPQSHDAPNPNAIPAPNAPLVSDDGGAKTDDVGATDDVPNEPTPAAPSSAAETPTERADVPAAALTAFPNTPTLVTPAHDAPPADDGSDTDPDDDVGATQPDISVYENAFDTSPSPAEPPSDNEGISDTPPNTVQTTEAAANTASKPIGATTNAAPSSGKTPRMYRGRRIRTGAYYPPLSKPTEKASLRCRETAGAWEIFVALPEDRESVKASYVEDELGLEILDDNEIRLDRFDGAVFVRYEDDTVDRIQLADTSMDKPLLFRMREDWTGEGRLVGKPSAGFVVAIAPWDYTDGWDDVDEPIEPEDCVDPNFQARFLFLKGGAPGAITPMRLEGVTLCDDSDTAHHGELYIGAPPELSVDSQISVAVIVEETGERADNKWVQDFQPHNQSIMSVLDGREGRLSVRTYLDGTLQESKPFRHFPRLRDITLDGQPHTAYADTVAFPDKGDGTHRAIELRFVADNGDLLHPTTAKATAAAGAEPADLQITDTSVVVIPPLPSIDAVKCEFPNRASITLALPRVWWRKTDPDGAVGDWSGAVFSIPHNEFAKMILEIKAPPWVNSISMGFGDKTDSEFSAVQGKARVELISFENAEELEEDLLLNIRINGQSAPIVRVLADPIVKGNATQKARQNLLSRYGARKSAAQTDMVLPLSDRFRNADGIALARTHMSNRTRLNEGDVVFGEVVKFNESLYELEIAGEHGQEPVRGVLPLEEMTNMTDAERAQIDIGHILPVVVVKTPDANTTGRALLSVDRLANYEQGEAEGEQ